MALDGEEMGDVGTQSGDSVGTVSLSAQDLLSLVEKTINNRLAKDEVKTKKAKSEPLRYKGNQKQLEFNSSVREMVSKAQRLFNVSEISKGMEMLGDVKDTLDSRNKMVRLADRSGWDVVEEYLGDSIASDSEDERKIRSAESRAFRKRKVPSSRQPFRGGARGRSPRAGSYVGQSFYPNFSRHDPSTGFPASNHQASWPTASGPSTSGYQKGFPPKSKSTGTCFFCGKPGHWASECELRKK